MMYVMLVGMVIIRHLHVRNAFTIVIHAIVAQPVQLAIRPKISDN